MSSSISGSGVVPTAEKSVRVPGHRSKRLKTDNPRITNAIISRLQSRKVVLSQPAQQNGLVETGRVTAEENEKAYSPRVVGSKTTGSLRSTPRLLLNGPKRVNDRTQDSPQAKTPVDFSTAPSDPMDLSVWVAQLISQSGLEPRPHSCLEGGRDDSLIPQCNEEIEADTIAESDKSQGGNRKRKLSSRSAQHERSMFNLICQALVADLIIKFRVEKDNDLRVRINAAARKRYGSHRSIAKTEWTEAEFNKRRDNRKRREEARAANSPGIKLDPKVTSGVFSKQDPACSTETKAAGNLLLNTLQGVSSDGEKISVREVAAALKSALDKNPRPFIEALRILRASPDVMGAITSAMKGDSAPADSDADSISTHPEHVSSDHERETSGTRESTHSAEESPVHNVMLESSSLDLFESSKKNVIEALEAATKILNDIAEGSSENYVTPYGNPQVPLDQNGPNGVLTPAENEINESKQDSTVTTINKADIDNFLKLAAGGSVSSEEDDDTLSDAPGPTSPQLDPVPDSAAEPDYGADISVLPPRLAAAWQRDEDVAALLQRVIINLETKQPADGVRHFYNDAGPVNQQQRPSFYGSATAKKQAAALRQLAARADIPVVNTIISAEQSLATSKLYAHLSSRAQQFAFTTMFNQPHGMILPPHRHIARNGAVLRPIAPPHGALGAQHFIPPGYVGGMHPGQDTGTLPPTPPTPPGYKRVIHRAYTSVYTHPLPPHILPPAQEQGHILPIMPSHVLPSQGVLLAPLVPPQYPQSKSNPKSEIIVAAAPAAAAIVAPPLKDHPKPATIAAGLVAGAKSKVYISPFRKLPPKT